MDTTAAGRAGALEDTYLVGDRFERRDDPELAPATAIGLNVDEQLGWARPWFDKAPLMCLAGGAADLSSARSLLQQSHTMFQEMGISRYAELVQERLSALPCKA